MDLLILSPRNLALKISKFEDNGLRYKIVDKDIFINKNVVISGGDSTLDWLLRSQKLQKGNIDSPNEFRGAVESVNKIQSLKDKGIVDVLTPATLLKINGEKHVESIEINHNDSNVKIDTDYIIPLYGLVPKMEIFKNWGLDIDKNALVVDNSKDYSTNIKGFYAIGDINTYPGKL